MAPDPRRWPARPDLAARKLEGRVTAARFSDPEPAQVAVPVVTLHGAPDARRAASQLLWGERFEVYERRDGLAWGQAMLDGYVGYVPESALGIPGAEASDAVAVPLAHLYPEPDLKTPPLALLPHGARLTVTGTEGRFTETTAGFIPTGHLRPLGRPETDPVAVAERFLHAPYLWGGRSALGIDCSGLVQQALMAAGIPCPRDSDMQAAELGQALDPGARLRRGDLVFWPGHVGILLDEERLLHANAGAMQVAIEGLDAARTRIRAAEGHEVSALRRL